jgi:hypothetical protein
MINYEKVRRESLRWYLLLTLHNAAPVGCYEEVLFSTISAIYPDATSMEIRKEVGYLEARDLVKVKREPNGRWFAELTRYGTDIAEYTIDCEPGIARPVKNWG